MSLKLDKEVSTQPCCIDDKFDVLALLFQYFVKN